MKAALLALAPLLTTDGLYMPGPQFPHLLETTCMPSRALAAGLARQFGERPVMRGALAGSGVFELWASPAGSFTIVLLPQPGVSCVVVGGEALTPVPAPEPPGQPL